jgi:hypothetical protein
MNIREQFCEMIALETAAALHPLLRHRARQAELSLIKMIGASGGRCEIGKLTLRLEHLHIDGKHAATWVTATGDMPNHVRNPSHYHNRQTWKRGAHLFVAMHGSKS